MRPRLRPILSAVSVLVLFALGGAAPALGVPKVDGEFDLTGKPERIAQGPDGNMWVTISGSSANNDVARVTPAGAVTEFDVAALAGAIGIAAGADGNMWVTRPTKVARFAPADPAAAVEFPAGNIVGPQTVTTGPDGNLWTASADKVMRITTAGAVTDFPIAGLAGARGIASSGGLLWVADFANGKVFSVTTAGAGTPHDVGGNGPQELAGGPAGQVVYGNPGTSPQTVGRLVAGGSALTTPTPGADPFGIAFGSDGAYWIAQFASNDLGRLTPAGGYTKLSGFSANAGPRYIATGPGNTLWVALTGLDVDKVARVTGVDPPPSPVPPAPPVPTAPRLTNLSLSRSVFRVGGDRTPLVARKRRAAGVKAGTRIRFTLSKPAVASLRIHRKVSGLRRRGKCVEPTMRLRRSGARRCLRWKARGGLVRSGRPGRNVVAFSGRIGRKALSPGRYRLTAVARDADGRRSGAKRARFRIAR